jgi:hypothetical protein
LDQGAADGHDAGDLVESDQGATDGHDAGADCPAETACDDGNPCTENDQCNASGECLGVPKNCDDTDLCTIDTCAADGICSYAPAAVGSSCDDGNGCTENDVCSADGVCAGTDNKCDDNVSCTLDSCDNGACVHDPALCACTEDVDCDDGIDCSADACLDGQCVASKNGCPCEPGQDATCDDGNLCTDDICVGGANPGPPNPQPPPESYTCVNVVAFWKECDDDPLTWAACQADGSCLVKEMCDDALACTTESFDPEVPTCNVSADGCGCEPQKIEVEDISRVLRFGAWVMPMGAVLSDGKCLEASGFTKNDYLHVWFVGTGFIVAYENGPNRGQFDVSVDGAEPVVVDAYAPDFNFQVEAVIAQGLDLGVHFAVLRDLEDDSDKYTTPDYFKATCP